MDGILGRVKVEVDISAMVPLSQGKKRLTDTAFLYYCRTSDLYSLHQDVDSPLEFFQQLRAKLEQIYRIRFEVNP
jgi:hypothetical protein